MPTHLKLFFSKIPNRVFSQHFGNMTRPLELGIFASFYTKLGKNTPYNKNKNIKYFVYSTSYSSLTHKQILKSDLQSDLPFVVGGKFGRCFYFLVCLGVIFAEFSDANACCRKSTSIFLLDSVFFSFFL